MLEKELETAIRLARTASETILEYYGLEIISEQKLGVDNHYEPVTAADRAASRIIVDGLARAFPEDAVLSEEEADDTENRLSQNRVWIIDPIDGTAGFVKKDGDFAVQIGLAIAGEAVLGIVLQPVHKKLFYAVKGLGTFVIDGIGAPQKLSVSNKTDFAEMELAYSRNHKSPGISRILEDFGFRGGIQRGSVGLKIGLIAEQICDLYIHLSPRTKIWDTCAPQIILEEAGGKLTDLFGQKFRYDIADLQNYGGIVASNGASHEFVLTKLKPLLIEFGRHRILASAR